MEVRPLSSAYHKSVLFRLVLFMLDKHTRSFHVLGREALLLLSVIPYI